MARFKTFANGAPGNQLLPSDLNAIQDEYELAFANYKELGVRRSTLMGGSNAAATFVLGADATASTLGQVPVMADAAFYLNPADYAAAGTGPTPRAVKLRIWAAVFAGSTATGSTWTVGLYPVATWGVGAAPQVATLGAVVTGSTIAFATPAANSQAQNVTADFAAPAAGFYVLGVANSAISAAAAQLAVKARLQWRNV